MSLTFCVIFFLIVQCAKLDESESQDIRTALEDVMLNAESEDQRYDEPMLRTEPQNTIQRAPKQQKIISILSKCRRSKVTMSTYIATDLVPAVPTFLYCIKNVYITGTPPPSITKDGDTALTFAEKFTAAIKGSVKTLLKLLDTCFGIEGVKNCASKMYKAFQKLEGLSAAVDKHCD